MTELWIVDIEASGLSPRSYPIEVGFYNGHVKYQALIIPEDSWCYWSPKSEELHGISRMELFEKGRDAKVVADELNALLGASIVYSDHEDWDGFWIQRLFKTVGVAQSFTVSDISGLLDNEATGVYVAAFDKLISSKTYRAHRALDDALVIHGAITRALA